MSAPGLRMTETCPWGLCSFIRVNSATNTIHFQQHGYPTGAAILKEAGRQLGVDLAVANGRSGSSWRHGPRDAPYAADSAVIRLPDGVVANIDSTAPTGERRRRNTKMVKDHFAKWLTGGIEAGQPPRLPPPQLARPMRMLLERAGIIPDRAAALCSVAGSLDANLADGCRVALRYNETYGHTGTIEIIPGVTWNGKCLTIRGTSIPETVARAIKGAPLRSVIDLEAFDGMVVTSTVLRENGFSVWCTARKTSLSPRSSRSCKGASMHSSH